MELVSLELKAGELLIADLDPGVVMTFIQGRLHDQPAPCRRAGDEVDDHLTAHQRLTPPVLRDEAEQPVLDLVPLARPRREVEDVDRQPGSVCQSLELELP